MAKKKLNIKPKMPNGGVKAPIKGTKEQYQWSTKEDNNKPKVVNTENVNTTKFTLDKDEYIQKVANDVKKDLSGLNKKYGNPKISAYTSPLSVGNEAAMYNPFSNTIHLNLNENLNKMQNFYKNEGFNSIPEALNIRAYDKYLTELPHAEQRKNLGTLGFASKYITNDIPAWIKDSYYQTKRNIFGEEDLMKQSQEYFEKNYMNSPYDVNGTIEIQAHDTIEPKIREEFAQGKFENGGYFDKKTGKKLAFGGNIITENERIMAKNGKKIKGKKGNLPKYDNAGNVWGQGFGYNEQNSQFLPPQDLQPLNVQMPQYQIDNNYLTTPSITTGYENLIQVKDVIPFDNSKPKLNLKQFNLYPTTGNKYLNRGMQYANKAIENASNITFKNGGLMKYANGNQIPFTSPQYDFSEQAYYNSLGREQQFPIEMNSMGQNSLQSINPQTLGNINPNGGIPKNQDNTQFNLSNLGNGIGTAANAALAGINFGKGFLDIDGTQRQSRIADSMTSKLTAQSIANQGLDTRPQDYIYNRNALAENGMQIKEIAKKGKKNINMESKEHVKIPPSPQLPQGFSQEMGGNITHAMGGIDASFPVGTKIYSEKLTIPVKDLLALKEQELPIAENGTQMQDTNSQTSSFLDYIKIPKKGKMSIADIAKTFETKKNVDMAESKYADDIQKQTADMMIGRKNENLDQLFNTVEYQLKPAGYFGEKVKNEALQEQGMAENGKLMKYETKGTVGKTLRGTGKDVENNFKDLEEAYQNYKKYGYTGKKDITEMREWSYKKDPQGVNAYITRSRPTNLHRKIWKEEYKGTGEPDLLQMDRKDVFRGYNDKLWDYRAHKFTDAPVTQTVVNQPVAETQTPEIQFKDRYIQTGKPDVNIDGLNLGIPLPNMYERGKLNFYKTQPNYIDNRYLNNTADRNSVTETQRGFQNNLGSRGTGDISNLLQGQVNAYKQFNQLGQQKWNYDRQDDQQVQQYNATAKTNSDNFNQQNWFNQLENPRRMIDSAIGDQELTDTYRGLERFDQASAYNTTNNFIDKRFGQYQNMSNQDIIGQIYGTNNSNYFNPSDNSNTVVTYDKNGNIISRKESEKKSYGGKVKNKLKIKPKLKK